MSSFLPLKDNKILKMAFIFLNIIFLCSPKQDLNGSKYWHFTQNILIGTKKKIQNFPPLQDDKHSQLPLNGIPCPSDTTPWAYFSWSNFLTFLPPHCITNLDIRAEFAHLFCHLSCLNCELICGWNTDNLERSTTNQFIATIQFHAENLCNTSCLLLM